MDNKTHNMIKNFLKGANPKNEDELNDALQEFMEQFNEGTIEYENTPLDDAYEMLEKAENAKSKKEAIKLAKKAFELSDECFEAKLFIISLEDSLYKKLLMLDEDLEYEKERLKKQKMFAKENIGHFYGIFETRNYISGLLMKGVLNALASKYQTAKDTFREILRLNTADNAGARYHLAAIYAILEEENELLKLYEQYTEENLHTLFPLFILYYKKEDNIKAKEYLKKIHKLNPHFIKFFKETLKENKDIPEGYFQPGDASEVLVYFTEIAYLFATLNGIDDYIIENLKA